MVARVADLSVWPARLMDSVREAFASENLSVRLYTEMFTPRELEIDGAHGTGQVRFSHSGRETANSGKTLLEQAEEAGLRPEHAEEGPQGRQADRQGLRPVH